MLSLSDHVDVTRLGVNIASSIDICINSVLILILIHEVILSALKHVQACITKKDKANLQILAMLTDSENKAV